MQEDTLPSKDKKIDENQPGPCRQRSKHLCHLEKPTLEPRVACVAWSNGLVVKALDPQSRSSVFKTTGWLQGRLSLSSFRGTRNFWEFSGKK